MTGAIEFTDRYGGRPPSWLRGCHGECEATGVIPLYDARGDARENRVRPTEAETDPRLIALWEHAEALAPADDGWHFVPCPDCHGTGRVSWLVTLARIPVWLLRGLHAMWAFRPGSEFWVGHRSTWAHRVWMNVRVAFLCDLGWRL